MGILAHQNDRKPFRQPLFVIASRATRTAWQSPETVFKRAICEFKNCFRVAYQIQRQCKKPFRQPERII
ncbi:MAG: hypothetical protein J5680_07100 [Neisseriaceae bacterium]|nr:hypothetical protein [Neisseriaceae bacterium]